MIRAVKINMREAGMAIKLQLQKYGKEISRDYKVELPADVENLTDASLKTWILQNKDKILKAEENLERKSILVVLLNSYLFSLSQMHKLNKEYDQETGIYNI